METKQEFIDGLRRALTGRISQEDVEEHIRYYEDYITAETRIKGSEQEVLTDLGNPKLIAMSICAADEAEMQSKGGYRPNDAGYGGEYAYEGNNAAYSDDYGRGDEADGRRDGRAKDNRPFIFRHPKLTIAMIIIIILVVIVLLITLTFSLLKLLWPVIVVAAVVMLIVHLITYISNR